MVKTIRLGSCVSVQGVVVKTLDYGRVVIRVGNRMFAGYPVQR